MARYEYVSNEKAEKDKTDCITEDTKGVGSYENKETSAITPWCPGPCFSLIIYQRSVFDPNKNVLVKCWGIVCTIGFQKYRAVLVAFLHFTIHYLPTYS